MTEWVTNTGGWTPPTPNSWPPVPYQPVPYQPAPIPIPWYPDPNSYRVAPVAYPAPIDYDLLAEKVMEKLLPRIMEMLRGE